MSTVGDVSAETPAPDAGRVSDASRPSLMPTAVRLAWLHLHSRRVPSALVALAACGGVLWAALEAASRRSRSTPSR